MSFVAGTSIYLIAMLYFTLKGKRAPLLISAVVGALIFSLALATFLSGYFKPAFSDFLDLPLLLVLAIYNGKAYRFFPKISIS